MEETNQKGLVLRARNYRENDKLLTILTPDYGKITAILKGVNKPNAKLKFAGQPFCLADFSLVKKGEFFTVTTASESLNFFEITKDYEKLSAGFAILEMSDLALDFEQKCSELLIENLHAFEVLAYKKLLPQILLIKYMLRLFKISGYEIFMEKCQNCKGEFSENIFFDFNFGNFVCEKCVSDYTAKFSPKEFSNLKLINTTDYDRLDSIKADNNTLNSLLKVLEQNFKEKFGFYIKSLKNL